jgi:hypothetical protein
MSYETAKEGRAGGSAGLSSPFVLVYAALTFKGLSSTKSIIQSSRTKRKMKKKRQRHEWVIMSR